MGKLADARARTVDEILVACRAANVIAWSAHAPLDDDEVAAVDTVLNAPPPPPPSAAGYAPIGGGYGAGMQPPPPTGPPIAGMLPPPPQPLRPPKRGALKVILPGVGVLALLALRFGASALGTDFANDRAVDRARDELEQVADADFDDDVNEQMAWRGLAVGDCFDNHGSIDDPSEAARIDEVDCSLPHDAEVYVVDSIDQPAGAPYPDQLTMIDAVGQACGTTFETFVGTAYQASALDVLTFVPLEDTWDVLDDRTLICAVYNRDRTPMPGGTAFNSHR